MDTKKEQKLGDSSSMFQTYSSDGQPRAFIDYATFMKTLTVNNADYKRVRHYHWSLLPETGKVTIQVASDGLYKNIRGKEHICLFVVVGGQRAVLKFRFYETDSGNFVAKFDSEHAEEVMQNYASLRDFLAQRSCEHVALNSYCILDINGNRFWCESEIINWDKFWAVDNNSKGFRISNSRIPILQLLQDQIYRDSGYTRTVVDLQGGIVGDNYILTDIEFTDSMQRLDWTEKTLMGNFAPGYYRRHPDEKPLEKGGRGSGWCFIL